MKELDLIRLIRDACPPGGPVRVGVGDDAAVIATPGGGSIVVTTDLVVEGTHFATDAPARLVGRKALAVSFSDIAAMGCRPTGAFAAVALRRDLGANYPVELMEGLVRVAGDHDCRLAGGDTTETRGPIVICTTVVGEPWPGRQPVLRSGASPGEALFVTGTLGGSIRGRHLDFTPRVAEGRAVVTEFAPGGMLDLSDGLSSDAWHLARESGVTVRIESERVPIAEGADLAGALSDGEDFELLFSAPADRAEELERAGLAGTRVTRIGTIAEGPAAVLLVGKDGTEEELNASGFEHFSDDTGS